MFIPNSVRGLRRLLFLTTMLTAALAALVALSYFNTYTDDRAKDRDSLRLAQMNRMVDSLRSYAIAHGSYPNCLYKKDGCQALEDDPAFSSVPKDPYTGLPFNYASFKGPGGICNGYHLGMSLERTASQALLTGSDAPPKEQNLLCADSEADFSGLSSSVGGHPCGTDVGTPQPTDAADGETCYDIQRLRLP